MLTGFWGFFSVSFLHVAVLFLPFLEYWSDRASPQRQSSTPRPIGILPSHSHPPGACCTALRLSEPLLRQHPSISPPIPDRPLLQILAGYFLLLPFRDEAGVSLGTHNLPKLFVASLLLTLAATPLVTFFLGRHPTKQQGLRQLYRFLALCILGGRAGWVPLVLGEAEEWDYAGPSHACTCVQHLGWRAPHPPRVCMQAHTLAAGASQPGACAACSLL